MNKMKSISMIIASIFLLSSFPGYNVKADEVKADTNLKSEITLSNNEANVDAKYNTTLNNSSVKVNTNNYSVDKDVVEDNENTNAPKGGLRGDAENTDISNATYVDVNQVNYGAMTEEGQDRWYLTYIPAGKITAYLQYSADTDIDLNLYLYEYDADTGMANLAAYSEYGTNTADQLSYVSEGGYYFVRVNSYDGFDASNEFALALVYSGTYDAAEPDDNLATRQIFSGIPSSISQTLDNPFDVDWVEFTVSEAKNISATFTNPDNSGEYQLSLYDSDFNYIGSLDEGNSFDTVFPAGTYYMQITTLDGTYDADNAYTIDFVAYDNMNTMKDAGTITASSYTFSDTIENEQDQNWTKFTLSSSRTVLATFLNPNSSVTYKATLIYIDSDGNSKYYVLNQNAGYYTLSLAAGTYYLKVFSDTGCDSSAQYSLTLKNYNSSTFVCATSDLQYIITEDSSENVYINGTAVTLSYEKTTDAGTTHDYVSVSKDSNSVVDNIGLTTYNGSTCLYVDVENANYYEYYSWATGDIDWPRGIDQIKEPDSYCRFIINLSSGQCVLAGMID